MSYLLTIAIIGLLIFVHELGHLLAAYAMKIPVERFSIGFGPVLWKRRFGEVEYCLSAIPLGGYVMPKIDDEAEFMKISVSRRLVLWIGGPLANFVSAGLLLSAINLLTDGFSWYGLLVQPWGQTMRLTAQFVTALPAVFMHPDQLSGIVGIVSAGNSVVGAGLTSVLKFAVILNLNLAVFNLLPIAPLDGGKIFCTLLEKMHPRLARMQTTFSVAGLALLLLLMLYTTVMDVVRQLA